MPENDELDNAIANLGDVYIAAGIWGGAPRIHESARLQMEDNFPVPGFHNVNLDDIVQFIIADDTIQETIRLNAYYRWEAAGRPSGQDLEFWLDAEAEELEIYASPRKKESAWEYVTHWFCHTYQENITVFRNKNTDKRRFTRDKMTYVTRLDFLIGTYEVSTVWSLRAELKSVEKLKTFISATQFRFYVLTGQFFEKSKRSRLEYLFRKGRPTLVFSSNPKTYRLITALCSHTTGYYKGTWAGAMTPTNEVISHLLRMRHDEYNFWKRASQHPPYVEMAGI